MKILTIGGAMRDIFLQYPCEQMLRLQTATKTRSFIILEEGKKVEVDAIVKSTGGGATNSALSFKRLGFDVESFFKIGTDHEGNFILEKLAKEQISTKHIARTDSVGTGTSFITPCPSGDRTVLVYRGANLTLTEAELPGDAISACDHLYITSLSGKTSCLLPLITQQAKKHNKMVATNPGTSQLTANVDTLKDALPNIDILIMNYYEANLFMEAFTEPTKQKQKQLRGDTALPKLLQTTSITFSSFHLPHFFDTILQQGPHTIAVTNGADGVYVAHKDSVYYHPSIEPEHLVSTLGAGDAFGSCFVAQLAQGKSIENAIRAGIVNSSSVLEYLNATTGLLTQQKLEKKLATIDPNLLQKFSL
jgi:sugar/nucleoside kinase (ribokinase family)